MVAKRPATLSNEPKGCYTIKIFRQPLMILVEAQQGYPVDTLQLLPNWQRYPYFAVHAAMLPIYGIESHLIFKTCSSDFRYFKILLDYTVCHGITANIVAPPYIHIQVRLAILRVRESPISPRFLRSEYSLKGRPVLFFNES